MGRGARAGHEGLVAKDPASPYVGGRSSEVDVSAIRSVR
jgi:ATP-dependent DNA ligase